MAEGLFSLVQGKANGHGDALSKTVTCYDNCAAMRFDYGSCDGQAQAGAAYPTTADWSVR